MVKRGSGALRGGISFHYTHFSNKQYTYKLSQKPIIMLNHFVHDLAIIMAKNNNWFNGRDNGRNSHFYGFLLS
jgi:hypothetical protein